MELIKIKQIKNYIKNMNVSKEFYEILELKLKQLIDNSVERAKANARRTVQSRDL